MVIWKVVVDLLDLVPTSYFKAWELIYHLGKGAPQIGVSDYKLIMAGYLVKTLTSLLG